MQSVRTILQGRPHKVQHEQAGNTMTSSNFDVQIENTASVK